MSGTRMVPADLLDLLLMHLARGRRRKLGGAEGVAGDDFYEDFFSDLDVGVLADQGDRRKMVRLGGVRDALRPRVAKGARVLDVGCGCGDNLLSLAELADVELHGVEYARLNVERARKLVGNKATIKQGSAMALPYAEGEFDALTCIEVLEHLDDDRRALSEMHRVLRSNGVLVLTVPHRHWFPSYRTLIGHERHYDRRTLAGLLDDAGFSVDAYVPNFPRWHRAADYSYVVGRIAGVVAARMGGESAPHRVRIPGAREPLLATLTKAIEPFYHADAKLDYATLDAATSVVARRKD